MREAEVKKRDEKIMLAYQIKMNQLPKESQSLAGQKRNSS
jgi:hypothetical protein